MFIEIKKEWMIKKKKTLEKNMNTVKIYINKLKKCEVISEKVSENEKIEIIIIKIKTKTKIILMIQETISVLAENKKKRKPFFISNY